MQPRRRVGPVAGEREFAVGAQLGDAAELTFEGAIARSGNTCCRGSLDSWNRGSVRLDWSFLKENQALNLQVKAISCSVSIIYAGLLEPLGMSR